jgi:threonylcarbamoyladenosine tRNA methylthiotransferase MtaB
LVLDRITALEENGYREAVLTGVNISDYEDGGTDLADLLEKMLSLTHSIRIRLSSLEPDKINLRLVRALSYHRICPHFHIPVQSGSDRILRLMRRNYTADILKEVVSLLRDAKKEPFLAADVLVGYPDETDADFNRTYNLIKQLQLSNIHVFSYSPRPGTSAYFDKAVVPNRVIRERADSLQQLSEQLLQSYRRRWEGREVDVLLEGEICGTEGGMWQGLSQNYLRVFVPNLPQNVQQPGELVKVRLGGELLHPPGSVGHYQTA